MSNSSFHTHCFSIYLKYQMAKTVACFYNYREPCWETQYTKEAKKTCWTERPIILLWDLSDPWDLALATNISPFRSAESIRAKTTANMWKGAAVILTLLGAEHKWTILRKISLLCLGCNLHLGEGDGDVKRCKGNDHGCCTNDNPCEEGDGDCDTNAHCKGHCVTSQF